jgi:hypothetical protein
VPLKGQKRPFRSRFRKVKFGPAVPGLDLLQDGFGVAILVDFLFEEEAQYAIFASGGSVVVVLFNNEHIANLTIHVITTASRSGKEGCVNRQCLRCHRCLLCHGAKVLRLLGTLLHITRLV